MCDANMEASVINEIIENGPVTSTDRVIILTARHGPAWEKGSMINIPVRWGLEENASSYRSLSYKIRHKMKDTIVSTGGLRIVPYFGGIERLLAQIEACDPDVIDLRKLGGFGQSLKSSCLQRFPGRRVLAGSDYYERDESLGSWRTYDPAALVSIILPTYNSERYLDIAIESCLNQTHHNIELIIVDDNSVDNTSDIINRYVARDARIKYLVRASPKPGLPESLNEGFNAATGKFLTWFQSDNVYRPTAIEYMVQQLCTFDKIGFVYCSTHHIDEEGDLISSCFDPTFPPGALSRWTVISGPFLYRREVGEVVGCYREECRYYEDLDFFIRACTLFPAKFYFEPCHFYRRHKGSLTAAQSESGRKWKIWSQRMYDEHFKRGRKQIVLPTHDQLLPIRYGVSRP
jgi:GT2 family glycosyltransferase